MDARGIKLGFLRTYRHLVLGLALANSVLYAALLPLWNGFDEPFHYSYVEAIAQGQRLPVLGETRISGEVRTSLALTPLSRLLTDMIPGAISVEQWGRLSEDDKRQRRADLERVRVGLRNEISGLPNYEAQQAPLAYLLLAPVDAALGWMTLPVRILWLRAMAALGATLLLYFSAWRLAAALEVEERFAAAGLFCAFLTQMLWASVAHVGNDALAIPLTVLFLASLVRVVKRVRASEAFMLAGVLSAGLLTKAYFLAFVPLLLALLATRRIRDVLTWRERAVCIGLPVILAGPWYARNLVLYRSLSGTQESMAGVGFGEALGALPKIPWAASGLQFARWSLWTGDWSFVSFSQSTLNLELLLMGVGLVLYVRGRARFRAGDWWLLAGCLLFLLGLIYQTSVTWISTRGASLGSEPWYGQGVLVCVWVLVFRGFEQGGSLGRMAAGLLCALSAWVGVATYLWKLPLFYATGSGRATLASVTGFWLHRPLAELTPIMLGPAALFGAALAIWLLLMVVTAVVCWREFAGLAAEKPAIHLTPRGRSRMLSDLHETY